MRTTLWLFLADRNLRLGDARDLIAAALKLSPDDFHYRQQGWVLYRMGPARAVNYLRKAYSGRPRR